LKNQTFRLFLLALYLGLFGAAVSVQAQQPAIRVAVLNFELPQDAQMLRQLAPSLNETIRGKIEASLVRMKTYQLVERDKIKHLVNEHDLIKSGYIDPETAARLNRMHGVDAIIYGRIDSFAIEGLRQDGQFSLNDLRAVVRVHFKLTNTTTASLLLAEEAVGVGQLVDEGKRAAEQTGTAVGNGSKIAGMACRFVKCPNEVQKGVILTTPKAIRLDGQELADHCRTLINQANEQLVGTMVKRIHDSKDTIPSAPPVLNALSGTVVRVTDNIVYVSGIPKDTVQRGQVLAVSRTLRDTDPKTGKSLDISERIGDLEITDLQPNVIVGRFSPKQPNQRPARGDQVTNP
jgi:hypothetical protein